MLKCISLVVVAIAFLGKTLAAPATSAQQLKDAKTVLVISALEPALVGQATGVTSFGNDEWVSENPGIDLNLLMLDALRTQTNRELKFLSGQESGLLISRKAKEAEIKKLQPQLAKLGEQSGADVIVVVHTTKTEDFIENRRVYLGLGGVGHFHSRRKGVFIALQATLLDCKKGTFTKSPVVKQVRALPEIEWHPSWDQYTTEEKRAFTRILKLVLKESAVELLSSAGLTDKWDPASKPAPGKFVMGFPPKPFISSGNQIEIIEDISLAQARELLRTAFKEREWTIVSDTDQSISATYRDDEEDTACTATFNGRQIDLSAETHETKKNGQRVKIKVDDGLIEDLKLATAELFLKAPASDGGS